MSSKLKLYNTLTNKKEEFKAINPSHITMYVCGPTVYDFAHVGNARPVVVFDTLAKLLRHGYGKVTYARNITDIDDKIIAAAANGNIAEITEKFARHYEEDMSALNAKKPDIVPKATDYLDEMIVLISDLIAKGYAYEANDHVLFQVSKMDDYGELSGRKVEDLLAGARVDIAGYKREAS
ncbi:MAG: cysteine--tRNA ligase, partial [Kordiimonadaceae bacterium]|nr:cysteine--tRNA ligase [Kordiimonadaceae bacterium]